MKTIKDILSDGFWIMPSTPQFIEGGEIPYITSKNIKIGNIDFSNVQYISKEDFEEISKNRPIKVNDMLISMIGTLGNIAIVKETDGSFYGQNMYLLRLNSDVIDRDYFYHFFNSDVVKRHIESKKNKSTQGYLKANHIEEIAIPVPSMEEQKEIASHFEAINSLIDARKSQLDKLDLLVKSRFIEMFGTVENNVFGYPVKTIGDVATLKSGTSLPSDVENEGGNIPYVKVGDMNYQGNEYYITTSSRYVSEKTAGKGLFEIGTVIFPKRGGAIGTNKKRLTKLPICADLNVMGVTPNKSIILPSYLMSYFELVDLGSLDNGSSVPQINNKDIAPLQICIPPIDLQNQFAEFVEQTDKLKFEVKEALEKLETLKKSLMQQYFG